MSEKRNKATLREYCEQVIDEMTIARAWGMSELSNWLSDSRTRLNKHSSTKGIWYLMIPDSRHILPEVLQEQEKEMFETISESPTIFRIVDKEVEDYFAEKEGELSNLKEHETIARMTLDCPQKNSSMISWSGSIRSCMGAAKRIYGAYFGDYRLYLFSPSKYMILRNNVRKANEEVKKEIFDTLSMAAMVFESDTENKDYSKYLHGRETEKIADEKEVIFEGYHDSDLEDKQIIEFLPVPLSFISMGQNGRFLAYNMMIPKNISQKSMKRLSLEALQKDLLYPDLSEISEERSKVRLYIEEQAFLYSIRIDEDTISQIALFIEE